MGIEEEGNARVNHVLSTTTGNIRQLFPPTSLALFKDDDLESKITSASSKNVMVTKSLGTVLSQALTADDMQQLDWIFQSRDSDTVNNTLLSLKEPKLISSLFRQIVVKFQSEDLSKQ